MNPSTYLTGETKVYLCKNLKPLYAICDLIDSQRATLTRRTFRIEEPQHTCISRYTSTERYFLIDAIDAFRGDDSFVCFAFIIIYVSVYVNTFAYGFLLSDWKNGTGQSFTQAK